jgi:hypothetical protein
MAFTTLQAVHDALPGQELRTIKGITAAAANRWTAGWTAGNASSVPVNAAIPSSGMAGDIPTDATTGAMLFNNPPSGLSYLGRLVLLNNSAGSLPVTLAIYDRLWQQSGIVVTTTTAQTVNSIALDRPDANGDDAELWLDVYAATGAGAATPTVSYTNPAGTAGQTATCIGYAASAAIRSAFPFQLASGDTGVKSIQSITLGVSMTSGTIGLVLRRKIAQVALPFNELRTLDAVALGLPRVYDNAALELLVQSSSAVVNTFFGSLHLVQG